MARFIVRRLALMVLLLIVISMITFLLLVVVTGGKNEAATLAGHFANKEEVHLISVKYGLNKPIYVRYVKTMITIFDGTAYSYQSSFNVLSEIKAGLGATLSLALGAGVIWLAVSILFGTLAAIRAGKYLDRVLTVLSLIGISLPVPLIGIVLLYYLGYKANIFSVGGGYIPLTSNPLQWFTHLILPWLTLSVLFIGFYSRVLRSTILDTMSEDYVRTARAKGLTERQVLVRHILRNSLLPIISLWGLDLGQVIGGGAILTESVYNLHGVGYLAAQSVGHLDIVTLLSIVMFAAFAVIVLVAVVDVLYAALDPRIRLQ
jgi:peptide/nickel transport system permease protein